jgi:hypothetical protein
MIILQRRSWTEISPSIGWAVVRTGVRVLRYRPLLLDGGTDQLYYTALKSNLTVLHRLDCGAHPSLSLHRALNGGLYAFLCTPLTDCLHYTELILTPVRYSTVYGGAHRTSIVLLPTLTEQGVLRYYHRYQLPSDPPSASLGRVVASTSYAFIQVLLIVSIGNDFLYHLIELKQG